MKRKIRQLVLDPVFVNSKTPMMKYLELKFEKPIEELIMEGGLSEVARKLRVDPSTVWLWRQRFGLPNIGRGEKE